MKRRTKARRRAPKLDLALVARGLNEADVLIERYLRLASSVESGPMYGAARAFGSDAHRVRSSVNAAIRAIEDQIDAARPHSPPF